MEVAVIVEAERVLSGEVRQTNTAHLVFVALDIEGKPRPVPPLLIESLEEQADWDAAEQRRALRLSRR
jgi:acyl-CoA hydrolase